MSTRHFLIRMLTGPAGSLYDPEVAGPYDTETAQCNAAEEMRDEELELGDNLLWLDIEDGVPTVGLFDPMFWQEAKVRDR